MSEATHCAHGKTYAVYCADCRVENLQKVIVMLKTDTDQEIERLLDELADKKGHIEGLKTARNRAVEVHEADIVEASARLWAKDQEIEQLKADNAELLKSANDVLNVQGLNGNWNYDAYMHGMFNGMELIVSILEAREPDFRKAPEDWLCDRDDLVVEVASEYKIGGTQ